MASTASMISPTTLPYLANAAAVFSIMPTAVGIGALFRPQWGVNLWTFPTPANPKDKLVVHGLMHVFGSRDLAVGLSGLLAWYYAEGNYKPLGGIMLAGTVMVITDGFVARKVNGTGQMIHWPFMPLNIGLGLGLLGWI